MKKQKHILLTFVGSNDAGKLKDKKDGPIINVLVNQKFDEVILLWNKSVDKGNDYQEIAHYLKDEIKKRKLVKKTNIIELPIKNVIDHNQIYLTLKDFTDKLEKKEELKYTAAISSGTPAMQVCWILLSESGDFSESNKLNLIQVKDPKFGESENIPVEIDTALPRIIRLKEEVENLKKDLVPVATISVTRPGLKIGDIVIDLTPIELCYFKYFAERVVNGQGDEKFPIYKTSLSFLERIIQIHTEFFPESDARRIDMENIKRRFEGLAISTFRGNVSKLNKKIKETIKNDSIADAFMITSEGVKEAKSYGIKAPKEKLRIVK